MEECEIHKNELSIVYEPIQMHFRPNGKWTLIAELSVHSVGSSVQRAMRQ